MANVTPLTDEKKRCSLCGNIKPLTEFYVKRNTQRGTARRQARCRTCHCIATEHPERLSDLKSRLLKPIPKGKPGFFELLRRMSERIIIDETTECWIWTGARGRRGYAQMAIANRRPAQVHRLIASLVYEMDLRNPKIFACHHCDNTACVNPDHLFVGTTKDNMADMVAKGRQSRGPRHAEATRRGTESRRLSDLRTAGVVE